MKKTLVKSIAAILAGFLTDAILSIAMDMILEKAGIFPGLDSTAYVTWMLWLALLYRTIFAILAGYVAAKLAPNKPMKHSIILATLGTVFAILGGISNFDKSAAWYPILLALFSFPSVWFGGKVRLLQLQKK